MFAFYFICQFREHFSGFSQTVRLPSYKGLTNGNPLVHSLLKHDFASCMQNLVPSTNQDQKTTSNENISKSNKMAHVFTDCSQNQSKLQKLGWRLSTENRSNSVVSTCILCNDEFGDF